MYQLLNRTLLNNLLFLAIFIEIATGIGAWAGGIVLGRYFAFFSVAFALISFRNKIFKPIYIGYSTLFAYFCYHTQWDYHLFDALVYLGLPLKSNNSVISIIFIGTAIFSIFSFFALKKRGFYRMFGMILINGMLIAMTLFHLVSIESGSAAYREYKMAQVEDVIINDKNFFEFCSINKMDCYEGYADAFPKDLGSEFFNTELLPKTKDLPDYKYNWLETDFVKFSMTYFYVKTGDTIYFAKDQNLFMILMEHYSMIFTILITVFTFVWCYGSFYLINKHQKFKKR